MSGIRGVLRKGCLYVAGLTSFYPTGKPILAKKETKEPPGVPTTYTMDYFLRPLHVTRRKKGPGKHRVVLVECRLNRRYEGMVEEDAAMHECLWKENRGWVTEPLRSGKATDVYKWGCEQKGWNLRPFHLESDRKVYRSGWRDGLVCGV